MTGKYTLIYADPPWTYRDKAADGERGAGFKYPVMNVLDICRLPVWDLAADDCLLAMWWVPTQPVEALKVVEAWGFKLMTMKGFTWHKTNKHKGNSAIGMGHMTRKADELIRTRVSRNVNEEVVEHTTVMQHIADVISWFSGSMPFLFVNAAIFAAWIGINSLPLGLPHFDPYPFGLLTMAMSIEAIFLSCFVLISQNRQAEKDRVRADIEYEVNIKAELEIAHLHEKADRIHTEMLERFIWLEKVLSKAERNA